MRRACAGLSVVLLSALGAAGEETPPAPERPKVVLVLSGGGARGSAHIGVIKVLEEYRVPVDMIVGTSMGSIVGGLYAAGWSSDEIEQKVTTIDWTSVFVDRLKRQDKTFRRKEEDARFLVPIKMRFKNWKPYLPPSVVGGQNLELLFQGFEIDATGERDFDRFPIPYRAVAADLSDGSVVVIDRGSLATAMRASMSIPGVFPPVELDGKPLADGGIAANFPVRVARSLGAGVIIGVDITSPLRKKEEIGNLLTRIDQVTSLLTYGNKEEDKKALRPEDIVIVPDLGEISFSDFAKAKETIEAGEVAARGAEARLRALSVSEEEYAAFKARHVRRPASDRVVDELRIENTSPLADDIVAARIDVPIGEPLDEAGLAKQLTRLYGLDTFGTMHHELRRDDGVSRLTIQTPGKPYGRNSLQFGFFLATDFVGDLDFNLTLSHLFLPINRRGGEWRNIVQLGDNDVVATEYYQPFDAKLAWYFATTARFRRDKIRFYNEDGDALADYTFRTLGADAVFGRVFGRWGALEVGAYRNETEGRLRIGSPIFPTIESEDGGLQVGFRMDTLDSVTWPRHGSRVNAVYRRSMDSFGADADGKFVFLEAARTATIGKNVMLLSVEGQEIFEGSAGYQNTLFLGGFLRLSGLAQNQIFGEKGGLARFMYYRELSSFDLGSLTQRMYVGFSLEAGNVYQRDDPVTWPSLRRAGSVYVGADTILGPAYFGYGYAEDGWDAVYLVIGQKF